MKLQKPLHHLTDKNRNQPKIDTGDGLTEQAHKNQTDMNYILKDYQRTGLVRHAKDNEGKYDDISVQDFQQAMITVASANSMFEELPSNIRKRFQNNPSQFLSFVQNPDNKAEMQQMGILRGNDGIDISGAPTNAPTAPKAPPEGVTAPASDSAPETQPTA